MEGQSFQVQFLDDNIVEVVLGGKVYLDVSVTDKIDVELERLAPGRKLYQLVMATGPYVVNPEMRNAMAQGDTGIKQLAIAWVSPDEAANREQEAIVSKLTLPVPIRFFSDRTDGLAWLRSLAGERGQVSQ
jgi:hypothetical protein